MSTFGSFKTNELMMDFHVDSGLLHLTDRIRLGLAVLSLDR